MKLDYKDRIQNLAETIAEERFSRDYFALAEPLRDEVYSEANRLVIERMVDRADQLRKEAKEDRPI